MTVSRPATTTPHNLHTNSSTASSSDWAARAAATAVASSGSQDDWAATAAAPGGSQDDWAATAVASGGSQDDWAATAAAPGGSQDDWAATAAAPGGSQDDWAATAAAPGGSQDDWAATVAAPGGSWDDSHSAPTKLRTLTIFRLTPSSLPSSAALLSPISLASRRARIMSSPVLQIVFTISLTDSAAASGDFGQGVSSNRRVSSPDGDFNASLQFLSEFTWRRLAHLAEAGISRTFLRSEPTSDCTECFSVVVLVSAKTTAEVAVSLIMPIVSD